MIKSLSTRTLEDFHYAPSSSDTQHHNHNESIATKVNRKLRRIYSPTHYSYEAIRLASFDAWPLEYISTAELAKVGFYYLKIEDLVQCYFCKGTVGYWERGDKPLKEHAKHFPNCPFIQGSLTSNVPIVNPEENKTSLYGLLNAILENSLNAGKPLCPTNRLQIDSAKVEQEVQRVAYPTFSDSKKRLYSFANGKWPLNNVPPKEKMAEAGFFYTGMSDFVQCFYCGGGLFNWLGSDDPREDHLKYYSFCPFNKSNEKHQLSPKRCILTTEEEDLLMQHPMAKTLLDMGLPEMSIKGALKEYLEAYAYLPSSLPDSIEKVLEWEDNQRQKTQDS